MSTVIWYVYRLPLISIPVISVIFSVFWGICRFFTEKNVSYGICGVSVWQTVNILLFVLYSGFVLYFTVFSRSEKQGIIIINPFNNFDNALVNKEFYRSMLMNVFLFVPLGNFVFNIHGGKYIVKSVLIIFVLSLFIEIMQFLLKSGVSETNDIICNFAGGFSGIISVLFSQFLKKCCGD